ncbi:hypothetical protein ACJMK2_008293 [Sinanodonta woodiana]|uniref:Uncharacterized protein n=1 Tax=Sinanodonta woodiana TaxID=1069815 RepID=A0ABD3VPF9_SINWO
MGIPKICVHYNIEKGCRNQQNGKRCQFLHICKYYIMGQCKFGEECIRNHDIDQGVKEILTRCGIDVRRPPREIIAELREDLSQNENESRSDSRPMISTPNQAMQNMSLYPNRDPLVSDPSGFSSVPIGGAYGGASSKMSLPTGGPYGGARSKMPDPTGGPYGGASSKMSLSTGGPYGGASSKMSMSGKQKSVDSTPKNMQICLHNLQGKCCFKDECECSHTNMPYQWQTRSHSNSAWEDLEEQNNLDVELEFCNPQNDECVYVDRANIPIRIFFEKMEAQTRDKKSLEIRRLSTVSSECNETRQPLRTRWCWFWLGPDDKWIEYGSKDIAGYQSKRNSGEIEKEYLKNPSGRFQFETQGYNYIIDFTTMLQLNMETKITRKVKRRPQFVNKQEAEILKRQ